MIKKISLFISSLIFSFFMFQPLALAIDPYEQICADNPDNSVCNTPRDRNLIKGNDSIIDKVANFIAMLGGVIAIVVIMISGLKFITSSGDSKKAEEARNTIIYAAVGLVVVALAQFIVKFVLARFQ